MTTSNLSEKERFSFRKMSKTEALLYEEVAVQLEDLKALMAFIGSQDENLACGLVMHGVIEICGEMQRRVDRVKMQIDSLFEERLENV